MAVQGAVEALRQVVLGEKEFVVVREDFTLESGLRLRHACFGSTRHNHVGIYGGFHRHQGSPVDRDQRLRAGTALPAVRASCTIETRRRALFTITSVLPVSSADLSTRS